MLWCRGVIPFVGMVLLILVCGRSEGQGQALPAGPTGSQVRRTPGQIAGFRTERLNNRGRNIWENIRKIVFARDEFGRIIHPRLVSMYEELDRSGHEIYIELPTMGRRLSNLAGLFSIEKLDPSGLRHAAVIRIYTNNIDMSQTGAEAAHVNGFIPFKDLDREERYVEVLGHEMAHAAWILNNFDRAQAVDQYIEKANQMLLAEHVRGINSELHQLLLHRDLLLIDLEMQAEAVELKVWQELKNGQRRRGK